MLQYGKRKRGSSKKHPHNLYCFSNIYFALLFFNKKVYYKRIKKGIPGDTTSPSHLIMLYTKKDIESLIDFLRDFDFKYEPIYTLLEDWLDNPNPKKTLQETLDDSFPVISNILFRVPQGDLKMYTRESHEGPTASWRLVKEII